MNNSNHSTAEMAVMIDRLVCGELDETRRQELLAWLDHEPSRWRICGLAFLEAQSWSQAIDQWSENGVAVDFRTTSDTHVASLIPANDDPQRQAPASVGSRRAALAALTVAGMMIAFLLGAWWTEWSAPTMDRQLTQGDLGAGNGDEPDQKPLIRQVNKPVLAKLEIQPRNNLAAAATVQIPVVPVSDSATAHDPTEEIPEYIRQQLERKGLKLTSQQRYLFAKLPDGEQVVLPVKQLQLQPVPARVY